MSNAFYNLRISTEILAQIATSLTCNSFNSFSCKHITFFGRHLVIVTNDSFFFSKKFGEVMLDERLKSFRCSRTSGYGISTGVYLTLVCLGVSLLETQRQVFFQRFRISYLVQDYRSMFLTLTIEMTIPGARPTYR
jgi:hypothetical protein